jgi:hypothetical protein
MITHCRQWNDFTIESKRYGGNDVISRKRYQQGEEKTATMKMTT